MNLLWVNIDFFFFCLLLSCKTNKSHVKCIVRYLKDKRIALACQLKLLFKFMNIYIVKII